MKYILLFLFNFLFSFQYQIAFYYKQIFYYDLLSFPDLLNDFGIYSTNVSVIKYNLNESNLCDDIEYIRQTLNDNSRLLNVLVGNFNDLECFDRELENYKSIGLVLDYNYSVICLKNIFYSTNLTYVAVRSVNVILLSDHIDNVVVLYPKDFIYNFGDYFENTLSQYTKEYRNVIIDEKENSLQDLINSTETVISFVNIDYFTDLSIIENDVYFIVVCKESVLYDYSNSHIKCITPSINTNNLYSFNITKYIEENIGSQYTHEYMFQVILSFYLKLQVLLNNCENCSVYQYKFGLLTTLYDKPLPIYSQSLSYNVSFYSYNNDIVNVDRTLINGEFNIFYHTSQNINICIRLGESISVSTIPIVIVYGYTDRFSREGCIQCIRNININGGINGSPVNPIIIDYDLYKNESLIIKLEELYNNIKYHIVIINQQYEDVSYLYRYFENYEIFFLSLTPSSNDTYYKNVGYYQKLSDSFIGINFYSSFIINSYIIGDNSQFSKVYYQNLYNYYCKLDKSKCKIYNTSIMLMSDIVSDIINQLPNGGIIICTFEDNKSLELLSEVNKFNNNEIKYSIIFIALSHSYSYFYNFTGHYIYNSILFDKIKSGKNGNVLQLCKTLCVDYIESNKFLSDDYLIGYLSLYHLSEIMSIIGSEFSVSMLLSSMKSSVIYDLGNPVVFQPNHYFAYIHHLIYFKSYTEYIYITENYGFLNNFQHLHDYHNYYCNYDFNIVFVSIVVIVPLPEFSYVCDMVESITSYENIFNEQENDLNLKYWSVNVINTILMDSIIDSINKILETNRIAFIITSDKYIFLYLVMIMKY